MEASSCKSQSGGSIQCGENHDRGRDLALLPNMLLRAPSAAEREIRTRKMDMRFPKFFSGQFISLVDDIPLSSVRTYEKEGLRIPRSQTFSQE